ncbi:MAG: YqeB family protein [Ancrocorticia sp.]|uniref:YqeB family protein n=1 Tax=Ancrocorticia sp. TaxID=2593684 RepID=UPI003F917DDE
MTEGETTISIPRRWIVGFYVAGGTIGFLSAFVVGPIVSWLLSHIGDAPNMLRIADLLPTAWAIPVLTIVGVAAGFWITQEWRNEVSVVTVSQEGITIADTGASQYIAKARIGGIYTDKKDLVITDPRTLEISRSTTDSLLLEQLQHAFEHYGYPWQGSSDPYESSYVTWVDGDGRLASTVDDLLRARQRALADKRSGAAEGVRDELRSIGIVVRDRESTQQYRKIPRE